MPLGCGNTGADAAVLHDAILTIHRARAGAPPTPRCAATRDADVVTS
jgi:hypothetical protein